MAKSPACLPPEGSPAIASEALRAGKDQVVGYASIVFTRSRLLDIARQAVETYIKTGKIIEPEEAFFVFMMDGEMRMESFDIPQTPEIEEVTIYIE